MRADELIERIAAGESAFDEVEFSERSPRGHRPARDLSPPCQADQARLARRRPDRRGPPRRLPGRRRLRGAPPLPRVPPEGPDDPRSNCRARACTRPTWKGPNWAGSRCGRFFSPRRPRGADLRRANLQGANLRRRPPRRRPPRGQPHRSDPPRGRPRRGTDGRGGCRRLAGRPGRGRWCTRMTIVRGLTAGGTRTGPHSRTLRRPASPTAVFNAIAPKLGSPGRQTARRCAIVHGQPASLARSSRSRRLHGATCPHHPCSISMSCSPRSRATPPRAVRSRSRSVRSWRKSRKEVDPDDFDADDPMRPERPRRPTGQTVVRLARETLDGDLQGSARRREAHRGPDEGARFRWPA